MNPMTTWGDGGKYAGIDGDSIGERGSEREKGHRRGLAFEIARTDAVIKRALRAERAALREGLDSEA